MQEDLQQKSVTVVIKTAKLTGRVLQKALRLFLKFADTQRRKAVNKIVNPQGKQSVKKLVQKNQGVANIEITDQNIKSFESVARKYGVDFALKKDRSGPIPKYLVFFKARDADALTSAFKEFTAKKVRQKQRPSVMAELRKMKSVSKGKTADRVKDKAKEAAR